MKMNTISDAERPPVSPVLMMAAAIICVSFASILIRFSSAPSIIIAFYRVFIAGFVLFVIKPGAISTEIGRMDRRNISITAWGGLFLALHFGTWIEALNYTTVANAVTLVDSAPLFALALSHFFLGESTSRMAIAGVIIALGGAAVISLGDFSADPAFFKGDMLAIAGAVTSAAYLVCGRVVRRSVSAGAFSVLVYGFAALYILMWCIWQKVALFGYSPKEFLIFAGLALVPTIGGHSLFQYMLKYMKAYIVNLGFLGEPVGAAILAYLIFNEVPAWYFYAGALLIFAGSAISLYIESDRS